MGHPSYEDLHGPEDKEDATDRQLTSQDNVPTSATHEEVGPTEVVELNLTDPHFMAEAYDIYADLRAKGPVSRVRFTGGEEEEAKGQVSSARALADTIGKSHQGCNPRCHSVTAKPSPE